MCDASNHRRTRIRDRIFIGATFSLFCVLQGYAACRITTDTITLDCVAQGKHTGIVRNFSDNKFEEVEIIETTARNFEVASDKKSLYDFVESGTNVRLSVSLNVYRRGLELSFHEETVDATRSEPLP